MAQTIPQPHDMVEYKGKLYFVISVNLGGKCKLKQLTTTKRIGATLLNIDINDIKVISNEK